MFKNVRTDTVQSKILPPPSPDDAQVRALTSAYGMPRCVAEVLCRRGLVEQTQIDTFLNPGPGQLVSPLLFADMARAVDRIDAAIRNGERICLYGDYDVDGITALSLLYRVLAGLSANLAFFIPNRLVDGYGLSSSGIEKVRATGATLLVTVDCGITSIAEIEAARQAGIDAIVTDHHLPGETLPQAFAIINPKVEGCAYPDKDLSGVGVAFKLAQAIYSRYQGGCVSAQCLQEHFDLVSIGTAADIVPLMGENRIFVRHGFEGLKRSSNEGVKALLAATGLYSKPIGTREVVFQIAPLINAVGRMGDPRECVELFITRSPARAAAIAATLKKNNEERRAIDQKITEECFARIDSEYDLAATFFIVVASEHWHPGVIGIVASRIVEKYCRPACVLNIENGTARGSARSIPNFHVQKALQACSGLLESFGGHEHAAGLSIRTANIDALRDALNTHAGAALSAGDLVPAIATDARIHDTDDIGWETVNWLKRFQPFGPRNRRPIFYAENLRCAGEPRIVGTNHLKFRAGSGVKALDAIAFKMGHRLLDLCEPGRRHTCAFSIEENEWNGTKTIQLNIRGIA